MTKISTEEISDLKKGMRPEGISKLNLRFFKKFGYAKCLWCKNHFIKHRNEQFYCTSKCRVYHFRKVKGK